VASEPEREVIIVGAGPAGAALACLLHARGHDVLLLDAARFPRDKVCGEGVSPRAWSVLEAFGAAERVRALGPHPLRGMALTASDGTRFEGRYPMSQPPGFALRRLVLDATLVEHARALGVEVREGTRVTALSREEERVEGVVVDAPGGPISLSARVVVGADGRNSRVAASLGLRRPHRWLRRFAVRGYWEGMQGLGDHGEMHVGGGGYCGVAPLSPTLANVAFVLDPEALAGARGDLEGFYRRSIRARWPRLGERLAHGRLLEPPRAVGPLAVDARALTRGGAVLVGDAAGFFDPFTGEGVTLALRSAELASEAISAALHERNAAAAASRRLEGYTRARHRETRDKFRFNRLVQLAVAWPEAGNRLARRLARRPDLADRLVGIAGDFVPARDAFGLRFAWDLLRA
jgi:geranylgeranyl reductase family protein